MESKGPGKSSKVSFEDDRKSGTSTYQQPTAESVYSQSPGSSTDSVTNTNTRNIRIVDPQSHYSPPRQSNTHSLTSPSAKELDESGSALRYGEKRDSELNIRYVSPSPSRSLSGTFQRRRSISRSPAYGRSVLSGEPRDSHNFSGELSRAERSIDMLYPRQSILRSPALNLRQSHAYSRRWSASGFGNENSNRLSSIREEVSYGNDDYELDNRGYIRSREEAVHYARTPNRPERRYSLHNENSHRNRSDRFEDPRDRYSSNNTGEERQYSRHNDNWGTHSHSNNSPADREESKPYSQMDFRERQTYDNYDDEIHRSNQNHLLRTRISSPPLSHEPSPLVEHDVMGVLNSRSVAEKIESLIKRKIEDDFEERMNAARNEEQLKLELLWEIKGAAMAEIEADRRASEELKQRTIEERIRAENDLRQRMELENRAAAIAKEADARRVEEISRLVQSKLELSMDDAVALITEKISQSLKSKKQFGRETYVEGEGPWDEPWDEARAEMEAEAKRRRWASWREAKARSSRRFPSPHTAPFDSFTPKMNPPPIGRHYRKPKVAEENDEDDIFWAPVVPEPPGATDDTDGDEHASDTSSSRESYVSYEANSTAVFQGGLDDSNAHKHRWKKWQRQGSIESETEEASEALRAVHANICVTSPSPTPSPPPSLNQHQLPYAKESEPKPNLAKRKRYNGLFYSKSDFGDGRSVPFEESEQRTAVVRTSAPSSCASSVSGRRDKATKRSRHGPLSPHLHPLQQKVKGTGPSIKSDESFVKKGVLSMKTVVPTEVTMEAGSQEVLQSEVRIVSRSSMDCSKAAEHKCAQEVSGSGSDLWKYLKSQAPHTTRMVYVCSTLIMFIFSGIQIWESRLGNGI